MGTHALTVLSGVWATENMGKESMAEDMAEDMAAQLVSKL